MSNCNNFGKALFENITKKGILDKEDIDSAVNVDSLNKAKEYIKTFLPEYEDSISGIWKPIIISKNASRSLYGSLLGNPQNIDDSKSSPCNCSTEGNKIKRNVSFAFNDLSDEEEDGVYCSYCQGLYPNDEDKMPCYAQVEYRPPPKSKKSKTNFLWPLSDPITDPPTGEGELYKKDCCEGGCDTRMKTDDITPKIPYLYNNYLFKLLDFKYLKQFPAIENPPLGYEKLIEIKPTQDISLDGVQLFIDWTLKARLGEIPPTENDTYHSTLYAHKQSYSRYLSQNKTAGNFILEEINTATPISLWQSGNMPLLSGGLFVNNSGVECSGLSEVSYENGYTPGTPIPMPLEKVIPSVEQFTIPYGITDDTHYNIFLKAPENKVGGYWKWNYTSGVLCWYRYYDTNREDDDRFIAGVDLYISDGDVFFAENDGPEPLATSGALGMCTPRSCPSGLKFTDYQVANSTSNITILPSNSKFIYVSTNIYDRVFNLTQKFVDFFKERDKEKPKEEQKTYKELFKQAAIIATGPEYDNITIDLFKPAIKYDSPGIRKDFIDLITKYFPREKVEDSDILIWNSETLDLLDQIDVNNLNDFNLDIRKKMTNKNMSSHNNINMVQTSGDLVNTLAHKYGCYGWIKPRSEGKITINKLTEPHATLNVDFEPVVKLSDTKNLNTYKRRKNLDCSSIVRGGTKIFSYDQKFSIGESYLKTAFLDEGLAYNAVCKGNPPVSTITDVASVMAVYFRDKVVFNQAHGDFQTKFEDIYSRFPSVSSTLDSTFSDLDLETDAEGNENVFFLNPDRLFRLTRYYDAIASNPSIDLVAFHEEGGCYYDSTLLTRYPGTGTVAFATDWKPSKQKYNPEISFKTYDMGIKVYGISSEFLRKSDRLNCKTLPLNQACSCWSLNKVENFSYRCDTNENGAVVYETPKLFTPFLSTKSIPLKSYGGYSDIKVTDLMGDFRIPNHPEPGSNLPRTNKEINVLELNGCAETFTVTLPNYVATKWVLKIPKLDPNGATIWVSFSDTYGFAGNIRNQNKIVINNKEIFPNEQTIVDVFSNTVEVNIYNQLLSSIFEDPNQYLYTPAMFSCSTNSSNANFSQNTGPSTITLTIKRLPNKNVLAFKIPPIQSLGKLQETFFEPNIGLIGDKSYDSTLSINKYNGLFNFDYGYKVFNNATKYPQTEKGLTLKGSLTLDKINKLNRYVNSLDYNNKIRLYLKLNDRWYEYEDDRTFGYYNTQENKQYHSWPTFFRETYQPTEPAIGPLIPAVPKVPLELKYFRNVLDWAVLPAYRGELPYPYSTHRYVKDKNDPNKIYIEGSRAYFMLPNLSNADNMFVEEEGGIKPNIFHEDKILYQSITYSGVTAPDTKLSLTDDVQIYSVDGNIDSMGSKDYESHVSNRKPYFVKTHIVKSKSIEVNRDLYASFSENNLIPQKYNNIYTVLELNSSPPDNGYINIYNEESKNHNFTIFPTTSAANINNNDLINLNLFELVFMQQNRESYSNKWADLVYKNNTADTLNNSVYQLALNQAYGPFLYDNILNYIMANNFSYSYQVPDSKEDNGLCFNEFLYRLYFKEQNRVISFDTPLLSYYVHQPFSLDKKAQKTLGKYNLYKTSTPVIDLNIYDNSENPSDLLSETNFSLDPDRNYAPKIGTMCISGIYRPSYSNPKTPSSDNFDFFVNLDSNFRLKPVSIVGDFYSRSLVLTEPYNVLLGIGSKSSLTDEDFDSSVCTNLVTANVTMPLTNMTNSPFDWSRFQRIIARGEPYVSYPIYCDIDEERKCGETPVQNQCSMNPIGNTEISSIFGTYLYKYKSLTDLDTENLEYAISIDAGLYCPLSLSGAIPYIVRSEFENYSVMFPEHSLNGSSDCINGSSYPRLQRSLSVWDDLYQYEISENIIAPKDIDIWANEIMFRAIHGSKQKLNLNNISKHNSNNISYSNILNELLNNTKNNIASVYDYIPYDYDKLANLKNIKVDGAFNIIGPGNIGDSFKITFNKRVYTINIKETAEAIIAECPEMGVKGLIKEKFAESKSLYIREAGSDVTSVVDENTTERVVDTCRTPMGFGISTHCGYKHPLADADDIYRENCSIVEAMPSGEVVTFTSDYASDCQASWRGFDAVITLDNSIYAVPISVSNNVPCSAFSIETADSALASNLDSFLTRYAASAIIFRGGGDSSAPLECGRYQAYPCSVESNCCGENTTDGDSEPKTILVKKLSYRIKNCHYDMIMKGLVTNSLYNVASYTTSIPEYTCVENKREGGVDLEAWSYYVKCCNRPMGSVEGDYEGGVDSNPGGIYDDCFDLGLNEGDYYPGNCCYGLRGNDADPPTTCLAYGGWVEYFTCVESYWYSSCVSPGTVYEIVETTNNYPIDNTDTIGCNRVIATFSYDNNEVQLNLGIRKILTIQNNSADGEGSEDVVKYNGYGCDKITTRGCPYIKVELPNNTYGINETITTNCQQCSTSLGNVEVVSNPEWQFQIDNNICILGTLLTGGSLNSNMTAGFDCLIIKGSDYLNVTEGNDMGLGNLGFYGERECGTWPPYVGFGAAETLWHIAVGHPLLGSDNGELGGLCETKIVANGGFVVNFPSWTTNGQSAEAYIDLWKQQIEERYASQYYCTNNYGYVAKDLIEGVIPGSCSLNFGSFSWPATAFKLKATLRDDQCGFDYELITQEASISVLVAYMTYQYKHPVSLEDKIIDELGPDNISSSVCRTYYSAGLPRNNCRNGMFSGKFTNVVEKIGNNPEDTCSSAPVCYDKVRSCSPDEYCCKIDLYGKTYLKG
jgi:hypothetical protein